jgi:hypothetical protein
VGTLLGVDGGGFAGLSDLLCDPSTKYCWSRRSSREVRAFEFGLDLILDGLKEIHTSGS